MSDQLPSIRGDGALPALVTANYQGLATDRRHGQDAKLVTLIAVPVGMGSALIGRRAPSTC